MINTGTHVQRSTIPWLVHVFLLLVILVAMIAALLLAVPPVHAKTLQPQQSQAAVIDQNRWQYNKGWNDGYRDTVKACAYGKHNGLRSTVEHRARISSYDQGYFNGMNAALKYARVCQPHHHSGPHR